MLAAQGCACAGLAGPERIKVSGPQGHRLTRCHCPENDEGPIGLAKANTSGNTATIETGKARDKDCSGVRIRLRGLSSDDAEGNHF